MLALNCFYTYKDAPRSKGAMGRRDAPTRKYPASQFPKKGRCFICDSDRHFMAQCPERHCAKCGERGHEVRYCPHTQSRREVFQATTQHSVVHETAVVVPVKWNGKPINVMMDTGADPSVVDRGTVQKMNIPYSTKYSQVYGLGRTALAVCGTACVAIDVGDGRPLEHEIEVLDTNNRVVILGRRFLARFKNTTFDWENMRLRLGGCWKTSLAAARGGYAATRAEIIQTEMRKEGDSLEARFDINPKLSPREETAIRKVLSRWKDVFAENPKSPQLKPRNTLSLFWMSGRSEAGRCVFLRKLRGRYPSR